MRSSHKQINAPGSAVDTSANEYDGRGEKATKPIRGFRKEFTQKVILELDLNRQHSQYTGQEARADQAYESTCKDPELRGHRMENISRGWSSGVRGSVAVVK